MHVSTIAIRATAMLAGASLIAAQVLLNREGLGWPGLDTGLGLTAIALPIATAIAVVVTDHAFQDRKYGIAAVAFLMVLVSIVHTLGVALERSVNARESVLAARGGTNAGYNLATKAHADAIARVRELEAAEQKACRTTGKPCTAARENLARARSWATAKQGDLAQSGAPIDQTGMAKRYGPLAELIDTWHPVALPLALEVGGLALIGFALSSQRRQSQSSQAELSTKPATKVEEAEVAIRALREETGRDLGTVREVASRIGHAPTTVHRALKRVS